MAIYYVRDCGHKTMKAMWGTGEDTPLSGLCLECREARIGQVIEFVRYGKPPVSGVSQNHRDGYAESGVSVYEVVNGEPQYVGFHFGFLSRPAYVGKGVIVGWGSDGEPLVEIQSIKRRAGKCLAS